MMIIVVEIILLSVLLFFSESGSQHLHALFYQMFAISSNFASHNFRLRRISSILLVNFRIGRRGHLVVYATQSKGRLFLIQIYPIDILVIANGHAGNLESGSPN